MDPESTVNLHNMSDADLVRYVADGMRPCPIEHSELSARLYGIAQTLPYSKNSVPGVKITDHPKLTLHQGGKQEGSAQGSQT